MIVLLLGLVALAARPLSPGAVGVTATVGLAGMLGRTPARAVEGRARWISAVALGCGAFAIVRFTSIGVAPAFSLAGLAASTVAAVAEEAFFRRLLYGRLERFGAIVAVGVSAAAFALVHLPVYGWRVFPLDLAAGVVLGWQRWTTGDWSAPAVTHVVANLLQMR